MLLNEQELLKFKKMISSLKNAQRAELYDENEKDIIDELYVDPLPHFGIREKVASDETVFIIGRKGTGKSTIFAAAQNQIRKRPNELSIYIDVKSLYGRSNSYEIGGDATKSSVDKILLCQNFINEVLKEILDEIDKGLKKKSRILQIIEKNKYDTAKEKIAEQKKGIVKPQFKDISTAIECNTSEQSQEEHQLSFEHSISLESMNGSISGNATKATSDSSGSTHAFTAKLIREFSMSEYMGNIKTILGNVGIRKLHIFLDDFSELEEMAQTFFVDVVLAPLNNWSEKFFRFKVACYPGRVYLGDIDKTKISEEYIDHYYLYKGSNRQLNEIEDKSMEFLERLLNSRFKYYLERKPSDVFQIDSNNTWDGYLELLFYATSNIPRVLGYLLDSFCDKAIMYDKKVTKNVILNAARDYYENKLYPFFDKATKVLETKENLLDRYGQEKLLKSIVKKAEETRRTLARRKLLSLRSLSTIPASHFYLPKAYEKYISTLELNYIVTKYFEQSDRSGKKVSIYALNYGLCAENNIAFGRPKGDRKYYIERDFDYTSVIDGFLKTYKVYICNSCKHKYEYDEYEIVQKAHNVCYLGCRQESTFTELYTFADTIEVDGLNSTERIPEIQYDVLVAINEIENPYATPISRELDCYYQMVNSTTRKLASKGLIIKERKLIDGKERTVYRLTNKARHQYFD